MRTRRLLIGVALLALTALPVSAQDAPARPQAGESLLAVVGGDIHVGNGSVIRGGTVLCRGTRIEAIGRDVEVPEGARVVDAKGRTVLPGFIAPACDGVGVRRGRPRVGERFADSLDPESNNLSLAHSAGITAFHDDGQRRGIYSETNAVLKTAKGFPKLMVLKEPAALTVAWTNSTVTDQQKFESLLKRTRQFIDGGKKGRAPAGAGVIGALERKLPVRITARAKDDIKEALRFAKRHDLRLVLENADEAWTIPEQIAAAGAYCVVLPRGRRWPRPHEVETTGSRVENAAILEKAGVPFCVLPPGGFGGRGAGISLGGVTGRDLLTYSIDAGFAVRGGASEKAAMRALTLTAAEALGVEDRIGSLEVGKDADIVVFQGDPLDFRNMAEVTIVSGHVVYERSKHSFFKHLPDPAAGTDAGAGTDD